MSTASKGAGLERSLLSRVLEALRLIPRVKAERRNSGKAKGGRIKLGEPGTPDIMVMLPRKRVLWLELKRPDGKGKLRESQEAWAAEVAKLDHEVVVIEDVQAAIDAVVKARDAA